MLLNGGFSPLDGFLTEADYNSVLKEMRLTNGLVWTMPITLDVSSDDIRVLAITPSARIALLNPQDGQALAILTVEDVYRYTLY